MNINALDTKQSYFILTSDDATLLSRSPRKTCNPIPPHMIPTKPMNSSTVPLDLSWPHRTAPSGGMVYSAISQSLRFSATKELRSIKNHLVLPHPRRFSMPHNLNLRCCQRTEIDLCTTGPSSIAPNGRMNPAKFVGIPHFLSYL